MHLKTRYARCVLGITEEISTSELLKLAGDHMRERWMGRHNVFNRKKIRATCSVCRREMEAGSVRGEMENPPYYCWRCSDKHEVGNPDVY
jgi:hypothetical protein